MSTNNNRTVFPTGDGEWANKRNGTSRPASLHPTQREANEAARQMLQHSGGGELTTMGRTGVIVSKDTIKPGHESKVHDTEH